MRNLHACKRYAWAMTAGLAVTGLYAAIAAPAGAQASPSTITAQQAIHDLKANYGVMIIPRNGVDLNTLVNTAAVQNPATGPTQAVARLAGAMDAQSRMVFIVVPATADRPVTTLSDAQSFDNADGTVTLHLSGLPADAAIRSVAAADNAGIDLRSDVGTRTVDLDATNMTVAEAISKVAAQTNTHWIPAYEITPPPAPAMARAPQYHRGQPFMTMTQDEGPTGPVYFHPTPPPPPVAQPAPSDTDQNNQPANDNSQNQAPVTPQAPVIPPYYVMQNGYAYDPFGTPYQQTYGGFTGGGYFPGSNLYLTPGYGGFFGGPPIVFGSTTTTF